MGERLQCQEEYGNPHDMYAVSVIRDDFIVGHLPRNISTPCHMFLHFGGTIESVVNGARRYSADLEQGGLEIPCSLIFRGTTNESIEKVKEKLKKAPKECSEAVVQSENSEGSTKSTGSNPQTRLSTITVPSSDATIVKSTEDNSVRQHQTQPEEHSTACVANIKAKTLLETEESNVPDGTYLIIEDDADLDDNEMWLKMCKITLFISDRKILTSFGSPLNDKHINLAQIMLKHQFSTLNGFCSTLLQHKSNKMVTGIQVFHCNYHWFTAAKLSSDGPLKVYDSVFMSITEEVRSLLSNKFEFHNLELATMQKQTESNICGLFAIAVATAIAYDKDPSDMHFVEHKMREHLCKCFEEGFLYTFPTM